MSRQTLSACVAVLGRRRGLSCLLLRQQAATLNQPPPCMHTPCHNMTGSGGCTISSAADAGGSVTT